MKTTKTTKNAKAAKTPAKKIGKRPPKLNTRQLRFAELVVAGKNATRAYLGSGYEVAENVAKAAGSRMLTNVAIQAEIARLRAPITKKTLLDKDRKREMLCAIAENQSVKVADRIRAIELDAKLAGHFEPERGEVKVGGDPLFDIKERAKTLVSALARQMENVGQPASIGRPTTAG